MKAVLRVILQHKVQSQINNALIFKDLGSKEKKEYSINQNRRWEEII